MNRLLSILNEIGVASALRHEAHKLLQLINLRYSRASKRSVLSRVGGLLMLLSFGVSCAVEEHEDPIVIDEETMPVSVVDITPYGATLRGSFGISYVNAHEVGIKLSLQNTQYIGTTGDEYLAEGIGGGEYELTITNLYADTTYYFKTFYADSMGTRTTSAGTYSFKTHRLTAHTDSAYNIYAFGATLSYTLSEPCDPELFRGTYGMYYSTKPRVIREQSFLVGSSGKLTNLKPGTTYYFRAFVMQKTARFEDKYIWGDVVQFDIPEIGAETLEPENITSFSADMRGKINVLPSDAEDFGVLLFEKNREVTIDSVGSTSSDQEILKLPATDYTDDDAGYFVTKCRTLKSNKKYFYRTYAKIETEKGGIVKKEMFYGEVMPFRTEAINMPTVEEDGVDLGLSVRWASMNYGASSITDEGTKISPNEYSSISTTDGWRLPNTVEAKELVDSCHWTWKKYQGVNGVMIIGPNGNSIFLPANMGVSSNSRTYGIYAQDSEIVTYNGTDFMMSLRFVQDVDEEIEAGKESSNLIEMEALVSARFVR